MSLTRVAVTYVAVAALVILIAVGLLSWGSHEHDGSTQARPRAAAVSPAPAPSSSSPTRLLFAQIVVVVGLARLVSTAARRIGQPAVIGEILGGIALGPTLFGALFPSTFAAVFAPSSLGTLRLLAEAGVALFMFTVGLDLDIDAVRRRTHSAIVVSHTSIAAPFLLGAGLAMPLYRSYAPSGTPFPTFALFVGVAMSITAFPVLARILSESGLSQSAVGNLALTCAAVDDVTAWCLLAIVTAIARARGVGAAMTATVAIVIFTAGMLCVARPLLARFALGETTFLVILFASAAITDDIGVHAIFGAFLAGVIVPRDSPVRAALRSRLSTIHALLLPLFFAFTGLRTEIGLLGNHGAWIVCVAVIVVATIGKLGGSLVGARLTGISWSDSFVIGTLMNSRGLMELIVLNVGYDLGIITPDLFTILVVMALVTTMATSPLLLLWKRAEWSALQQFVPARTLRD